MEGVVRPFKRKTRGQQTTMTEKKRGCRGQRIICPSSGKKKGLGGRGREKSARDREIDFHFQKLRRLKLSEGMGGEKGLSLGGALP